ncbi:MAG: hypothetical protein EZS28_000186 [Streblomastix strix]|uniref:Uncharacterized protein n=1 Tax=Streblomastix strix TaxID=222440 RepID=A0A5J4XAQ3_9EUKA|nr:MAG: hypothetical protein EZS28_000186 [Streblomastix strix]
MTSCRMLLIIVLTIFSFGWSFPFAKQKKDDRLADAIDLTKLPSRNETMTSHQRISNTEECTSNGEVEVGTCICTQQFHPDGCLCSGQYNPLSCTCPDTPDALQGIEEIQCKCVDGDLRTECEGYHYQPEDEIFFPHYEFDQEGKYIVSTYNGRKQFDRVSIHEINRLGEGSENDGEYIFSGQKPIEKLEVSKQLDYDIEECRAKRLLYEQYYKLLGYAAYAYLRQNIAPSFVYALMNAPREGTKIDIQDPRENETFGVERGCNQRYEDSLDENIYVGFEKDGIVDSSCVNNSQEIPYSTINDAQDRLPVATRCADQKEIKHYLKGLKIGLIQEVSTYQLLSYLVKVGPVIGKLRYISDGSDSPHELTPVEGIIIGWKYVQGIYNWIMVQQNGDEYFFQGFPSQTQGTSGSYFTGKVVFYQDPQITKPPTEEPPIDDTPIDTEREEEVVVDDGDRKDDGTVKDQIPIPPNDRIFNLFIILSSIDSPNEIYEQTNTIEIEGNNALVLQSNSEGDDLSVLRAISHSSEINIDVPSLVHISGDAQMEINSFIIEHSQDSADPLLRTEGYSLFRLIGVTLSGQTRRRDKETDTVVVDQQQQGQFQSPFLEARGKKVVMKNVIVEPTNFVDCNAIDINGENDVVNHQLLTEDSTFQQWNDINGGKSYLNLNKFTAVFKNSHFQGVDLNAVNANKQRINAVTKQTCDWNTASVNIDNSTGYFDKVTFNNLGEGALKVGNNAIATLKESVQFYRKYPIQGTDASQLTPRNIVCGKDGDLPSQLLAESSSFKEAGTDGSSTGGSISKNKWISADKDNCKITGTLNDEKYLLFTPEIQSITAKGNNDKTGIDVELKGKSLFKCGKLFLMVSLQPKSSKNADDITSKEYPLEDVAQTWDSEESVIATIKEDDLVKKGAKLSVSVRMETKDGSHSEAEVTGDGKSSTDVEGFGKGGLSTGALIGIIVAAVVVVIVVVVLIIVCCYCCTKKSKKSSSSEKNQSSEGVEMKSNKW